MSVSVILALDGGAERSLRCLAALASVPDDPPHEVVVVDDASADLEPVLARIEGGAKIVRLERRAGLAAALRAGARSAPSGDVVVLLRGAAEVDPGFLTPLVAALDDARPAAVPRLRRRPVRRARRRAAPRRGAAASRAAPDELLVAELLRARRRRRARSRPASSAPPAPARSAPRQRARARTSSSRSSSRPSTPPATASAPASPRSTARPTRRTRSSSSTTARRRRASPRRSTPACAPRAAPTPSS